MEPKYKVNPLTGELQEYVFEYNGILALRNFTARVEDERLILHAADDVNFSILEALVSEVEINGVVYDNPTAAQEALTRLTFNQNRPVLLDKSLKDLILGAVQKVEGKGLSSNDFTNAYKQQLDTLEDYDIELDESTTELKFKKGSNVIKRISLMFLDDEGTKLVYNKANKTLELRDKRDNLLTSIPISHFVSNIPTSIVVQNGKIKLMSGSEVIGENTISYNDLADKPELNYLPLSGGTVSGEIKFNSTLLLNDIVNVVARNNGGTTIAFGNKPFNLVYGEFKGIKIWNNDSDDKVVLAGGGVTNLSELKNENVKVGGRNYVLKSKEKQTSVGYIGKYWTLSEPAIVGIQYTFSCYASVEDGRQLCVYFTDIDGQRRQYIITDLVNGYNEFTIIPNYAWTGLCAFHEVSGVSPAPTATIEKLKFEKGNKATDWTPAPEDLIAEKTWEKQQHSLYGESLVTTLPSVQREVVIDNNSNSKNNLWTADNELNVGSRNVGGYAKINCNGYKLTGKDDNFVLTAGGGAKNLSDFDFYKGSIEPNDLNVFQSRKTGVYVVKYPAGWGTLVNFKSDGSTSSIEFLKRNWYAWSRIGVRNSVDDARFNEDNGEFRDLAWYSDVYRPGIIRYNWDATKEHQNDTVFVSQSGYIELNQLENLSSMSFRKVFSNGNVEFRCSGKQIIYTGDNQFNGKDGSTAVVSIYENKCYIDIRNI